MMHDAGIADPPRSLGATLAHLGPGIILASSIVGSGELIATTSVGATAGFGLLWLIVVGCGIKVAAQIEIGRTTLAWGRTPLAAFDRVPGPRLAPSWAWDLLVWISAAGFLVVGLWTAWDKLATVAWPVCGW
jgi:manganese transport protein